MDELDAYEAATYQADDPNTKAHAYIRALERQLEESKACTDALYAKNERLEQEMQEALRSGMERQVATTEAIRREANEDARRYQGAAARRETRRAPGVPGRGDPVGEAIADSTGGVETWPADDFRRVADARRQALESALRAFDGDEGSER